jgi:Fe(3+) dicitrate transport protein
MMKYLGFRILLLLLLAVFPCTAQYQISGQAFDEEGKKKGDVEIFNQTNGQRTSTDNSGYFTMEVANKGNYKLVVFSLGHEVLEKILEVNGNTTIELTLKKLSQNLSEVVISEQKERIFNLKRLNPVEGTAIYAGKKSEVILLDQMVGNKAGNNARQVYAQVVGLNIYENSDAGLQLNIGGRGLDPNRTANFNTRQNGYDISADVLGYPESYYTPPAEALEEIQVVRGAASLQYGTQFGGLLNFKMKEPVADKKIQLVSRQSTGSFNMFSSFNSLSGSIGKLSYYTYFHHKQGDGFRPNSDYNSNNAFTHLGYQINQKTKISLEYTYLNYLAQQAGGLTDANFEIDPKFSNRTRNWFQINWHLAALKLNHKFSTKTDLSVIVFGLSAGRNALGYRGNPVNLNGNPVSEQDPKDELGNFIYPRDLIVGKFKNYGTEVRLLSRYKVKDKDAVFLIGTKFYRSQNTSRQGVGSIGTNADFSFKSNLFPDYANQSDFSFPNLNASFFGENIFFVNDKISITPGFRFENIRTESDGIYNQVVYDNAQNPIANRQLSDNRSLNRSFLLFGIGASYIPSKNVELYANISQNYRSVTFNDIRVVSPTFIVDPDISDEDGYTADFGARGRWNDIVNYDLGAFGLLYNDRIGVLLDDRANRVRKNIGKAFIYGLEVFGDINLLKAFQVESKESKLNWFINTAITESQYLQSEDNNVKGKKVEFIPQLNLKTGFNFGYRNLLGSLQWMYLSQQFTDVENSLIPEASDSRSGVIGQIPAYDVMDFSLAYKWRKFRLESGINNLLNRSYFTRRATGYPGPGIIPSESRTWYVTVEIKL